MFSRCLSLAVLVLAVRGKITVWRLLVLSRGLNVSVRKIRLSRLFSG